MKQFAIALFFLSLSPIQAADQAAAFFDDSAVREIRITFDNANWYNTLFNSHNSDPSDPYFPARFQYGSTVIPRIGVRFKGNSSFRRNGVKKPWKLDFNEYDDNALFFGLKKLNLHNGDLQPDFMHEKLFLDFAGKYISAMRAVHVRLYVNDVYYGLYLAVEQPDKTMMQSRYGDDEDGNLYEAGESVSATMSYLGANASSYTSRYELKNNEDANDYSGLINMLNILNNTATAQLPAALEPVMDIEDIMKGMALNALFTNVESYLGTASEYFIYQRTKDNRFVHIHWDTNETFGSTGDGTPRIANPFTYEPFTLVTATGTRPLLEKLWAVPAYRRLYLQVLAKFLREGFDETSFGTRSQALANLIRADYTADPNKAYTMGQFETALTNQVTANNFTTYGITQFVRQRVAYLRPYLNNLAQPSDIRINEVGNGWVELHNLGPGPISTAGLYLSDDNTNRTKWPVPAQTLEDGAYLLLNLAIPASGSLYLSASDIQDSVTYANIASGQAYARTGLFGSTWSMTSRPTPNAANAIVAISVSPTPPTGTGKLLVTELMADNDSAFADPDEAGAFEDWFEVFNPGTSAVDMGGMYITDNPNNPTKWQVPAGVTIAAGGRLVFIADGETTQGSRHTSWSLSADGESVSIYDTDGKTLIDTVSFGPQFTDVAIGRTTDGAVDLSLFSPATPGAANSGAISNWIRNGAGYQIAPVAPNAVVSIFAAGLATSTVSTPSTTLPTSLGGLSVTLTPTQGTSLTAPLYFVSPNQVNFLVPASAADGKYSVAIRKADGSTVNGTLLVRKVSPALFSANADGLGVGLLAAIRGTFAGVQTNLPVYQVDSVTGKIVGLPISLGAETDQVYLVLYGTGIRNVAALTSVTATVGGTAVPVAYAAAQSEFPGLDQVNIGPLPRSLAGRGEAAILLTVDGQRSNSVTVNIQ